MKRIGLLSDTHGYLDTKLLKHFEECEEIWHAGDFGPEVAVELEKFRPLKGVYGNIDGHDIRITYPESLQFECENVKVLMIHIGGYPGRYSLKARQMINSFKPDLFISGHSHILKVIRDPKIPLLHMNPGAAGTHGFHKMRTALRFTVDGKKLKDLDVVELGPRVIYPPDIQ